MAAGLGTVWVALAGTGAFATTMLASSADAHAELARMVPRVGARLSQARARFAGQRRDAPRARKADARRDMPTFLDIVTLGLSAGLSFDASLELYCKKYDTMLARSMANALLAWRMGYLSRAEALEGVSRELDLASLNRFSMTVSEALAFGTPLADALERQAQSIRDEQRSELEAEIERVPVKMLIPLGTLIVPAMLLAILGPLLGPALSMA